MSQSAAHRADGRLIDDYALIADTETAALVSRDGSIDWLCLPRFDSAACFTALLGTGEHGFWRLAPREEPLAARRRYRPATLVLETQYETSGGAVRVVDCMPLRDDASLGEPDVVRVVEGVEGEVAVDLDLAIRFDYGSVAPRLRQEGQRLEAVGGPDAVVLTTPVELHQGDRHVTASFTVHAGEQLPFVLTWFPSHEPAPDAVDAEAAIDRTTRWWREWLGGVAFDRAVQASDGFGLDGPRQRWARVRDEIRDEILREGFDREHNTFTQSYGSRNVDASLLMIPLVGFLPGDDPRVLGTIDAIERDLVVDGLVRRYDTRETRDGLRGGEGMFLLTSFWLVDALAMAGRVDEATRRFERLLDLRNDVGLLAEEYDLATGQMLGNMPQAFSHVALVSSAWHLQAISEDRHPSTAPRGHERASRSDAE